MICAICGRPIKEDTAVKVIGGAFMGGKHSVTCDNQCGRALADFLSDLNVWHDEQRVYLAEV